MFSSVFRRLVLYLNQNEKVAFQGASLPAALRRIKRRGLEIGTVIDIGASNGHWSKEVEPFFPGANFLLVEAQERHRAALDTYIAAHPKAYYVLKAAGEREGTIHFDATEEWGGQAISDPGAVQNTVEVPVTTIDKEVAARNLSGPYLLKFDVHGYELPILAGAHRTLEQCELIIMECYNFDIGAQAQLFPDMCRSLAKLGFRVIDLSEPMWRPTDGAFWQIDLLFVRNSRPEFSNNNYD